MGLNEINMPAILPHAATEICRHALGNARIQEALLTGKMYKPQEGSQNGIFHETSADWESTVAAARAKVALPASSIKAYGQMKAMLQRPAIEAAADPAVGSAIFKEYWGSQMPAAQPTKRKSRL